MHKSLLLQQEMQSKQHGQSLSCDFLLYKQCGCGTMRVTSCWSTSDIFLSVSRTQAGT